MLRDALLLQWRGMFRKGSFNYHSLHTTPPEEQWDLQHQYLQKTYPYRPLPVFLLQSSLNCEGRHVLLPLSQSTNCHSGWEHGSRRRTSQESLKGMGYPDTFLKMASKLNTAAELTEAAKAKDIYSLCGRTDLGNGTGMQTIQHQDCLLIIIHTSQTVDVS